MKNSHYVFKRDVFNDDVGSGDERQTRRAREKRTQTTKNLKGRCHRCATTPQPKGKRPGMTLEFVMSIEDTRPQTSKQNKQTKNTAQRRKVKTSVWIK